MTRGLNQSRNGGFTANRDKPRSVPTSGDPKRLGLLFLTPTASTTVTFMSPTHTHTHTPVISANVRRTAAAPDGGFRGVLKPGGARPSE